MSNVKTYQKSDLKITPNFKVNEFACHDGTTKVLIDYELVCLLQFMRDIIGKPLVINSGYRTESHNKAVGGAANSYHKYGRAFDVAGADVDLMCKILKSIGVKGIIKYPTFVHMDSRDKKYHANNSNKLLTFETIKINCNFDLLKKGSKSYQVGVLQFRLNQLGFNCGKVDGVFGNGTYKAVCKFQKSKGLIVDGIVGAKTIAELF